MVSRDLVPLTLGNQTLDFTTLTGGTAGVIEATVPEGYGNVSIWYRVLADCPGGHAAAEPSLVAFVGEAKTDLWTYAMVASAEPYTCSPGSQFMDRERATGTLVLAARGNVQVRAQGVFTGEAIVGLTATV